MLGRIGSEAASFAQSKCAGEGCGWGSVSGGGLRMGALGVIGGSSRLLSLSSSSFCVCMLLSTVTMKVGGGGGLI